MQLGKRWAAHTAAPSNMDAAMLSAIAEVERELHALKQDTSQWYWTLTYLENRPVVQLDDGTTLRLNADGYVSIQHED